MKGGLSKEVVSDKREVSMGHTTLVTRKAGLTKEVVFHEVVSQKGYYCTHMTSPVYTHTCTHPNIHNGTHPYTDTNTYPLPQTQPPPPPHTHTLHTTHKVSITAQSHKYTLIHTSRYKQYVHSIRTHFFLIEIKWKIPVAKTTYTYIPMDTSRMLTLHQKK